MGGGPVSQNHAPGLRRLSWTGSPYASLSNGTHEAGASLWCHRNLDIGRLTLPLRPREWPRGQSLPLDFLTVGAAGHRPPCLLNPVRAPSLLPFPRAARVPCVVYSSRILQKWESPAARVPQGPVRDGSPRTEPALGFSESLTVERRRGPRPLTYLNALDDGDRAESDRLRRLNLISSLAELREAQRVR